MFTQPFFIIMTNPKKEQLLSIIHSNQTINLLIYAFNIKTNISILALFHLFVKFNSFDINGFLFF